MFETDTATDIARALDRVQTLDPEYTGPLSLLDEAVSRWTDAYPDLVETHRAFADARHQMRPAQRTDASVWQMRRIAATLADRMRALGDVRLTLCQAQTGWGTCNAAIVNDNCPYPHTHVD